MTGSDGQYATDKEKEARSDIGAEVLEQNVRKHTYTNENCEAVTSGERRYRRKR